MESAFDDVTVDHLFVGLAHLADLLLDFVLEDIVEMGDMLLVRKANSVFSFGVQSFAQKHL